MQPDINSAEEDANAEVSAEPAPTNIETEARPGFYGILDVSTSATMVEIKRAYKDQALRWHPDKVDSDAIFAKEQFQAIAEAYEILSNEESRARYDEELVSAGVFVGPPVVDQRPTAAELHPEGFDQCCFRASPADLRALSTFRYAERCWHPDVRHLNWARLPRQQGRVRVTFSAFYKSYHEGNSPSILDFSTSTARAHVHTAFREHLDNVLEGTETNASFYVVNSNCDDDEKDDLHLDQSLPLLHIRIGVEGETLQLMESFKVARTRTPGISGSCPFM